LDIPPRLQWEENYGYCGEVSLISAGLYYGQYISQYDARAIASPGVSQASASSQLLIGVNDTSAASTMKLNSEKWTGRSSTQFLQWVKAKVAQGYPVSIGIFMNQKLFYGSNSGGDSDYDHIVPVTGIQSKHPLSDNSYYADDVIQFSDNGLWTGNGKTPVYNFSSTFGAFQLTRSQANGAAAPVYSLTTGQNYGIAITGVKDLNGDTLPVRLKTNINYENPDIKEGSNTRPAAQALTLTATISNLQPGVAYKLYRYDNFGSVPTSKFNTQAANAAKSWDVQIASGTTYSVQETIMSNQMAIYRAVRASAP
jgi:hypothetical protein